MAANFLSFSDAHDEAEEVAQAGAHAENQDYQLEEGPALAAPDVPVKCPEDGRNDGKLEREHDRRAGNGDKEAWQDVLLEVGEEREGHECRGGVEHVHEKHEEILG